MYILLCVTYLYTPCFTENTYIKMKNLLLVLLASAAVLCFVSETSAANGKFRWLLWY
jgi:hypothetical protein